MYNVSCINSNAVCNSYKCVMYSYDSIIDDNCMTISPCILLCDKLSKNKFLLNEMISKGEIGKQLTVKCKTRFNGKQ